MSKLETITIDTPSGSNTMQIGSTTTATINLGVSGDTINVPAGVTIANAGTATGFGMSTANTPMFSAYRSGSGQGVSGSTWTKLEANTELFDTDSAYDNSSNYRFTVPSDKAGKYFFVGQIAIDYSSSTNISSCRVKLYKNGSNLDYTSTDIDAGTGKFHRLIATTSVVLDLSASDYIETYGKVVLTSGTHQFFVEQSRFLGYKLT